MLSGRKTQRPPAVRERHILWNRPTPSCRLAAVMMHGRTVRALRRITQASIDQEPEWRHSRPELTVGYKRPE